MYELNDVVRGITEYIDNEIIYKINGWQRWVVGAGIGLSMSKATNIFNELKNNKIVKTLELIDKDDRIDVDTIYRELKKQASRGAITFDLPMVGAITLNEKDVNSLYNYIKRGD